jgi:nicotinamide-nucleotide amidase
MNAEIVSIGSELLLGQIVDTNASWIAQRLAESGVNLFYKTTVGDNLDRMVEVLDRALDRSDVVITGGGIGPTQDDLTREAIAKVTGREVVTDPDSLTELPETWIYPYEEQRAPGADPQRRYRCEKSQRNGTRVHRRD